MPKMTPEEEARYALGYGVDRKDLPEEAQEAYDRLVEQRRRGELVEPVSLADAEAAGRQVVQDAREALALGRRIFLCRVPMMYDRLVAVGTSGLAGPSSVIEAVENLGWRLDHMSWVPRAGFRAEGFFLFRRDATSGGSPASE
jgi:hypothetical protein